MESNEFEFGAEFYKNLCNDIENFDPDKFNAKLNTCIENPQFDINYINKSKVFLRKPHNQQCQFEVTKQTLLHFAIDKENYIAAAILVNNGANPFITKSIASVTETREFWATETTYLYKGTIMELLKHQWNFPELSRLKQSILIQTSTKFKKDEYNSRHFDQLAEIKFWKEENLVDLFLEKSEFRTKIWDYLSEVQGRDVANKFVIKLILQKNSFLSKDQLMGDLEQKQPKLTVEDFKILYESDYFTSQDLYMLREHFMHNNSSHENQTDELYVFSQYYYAIVDFEEDFQLRQMDLVSESYYEEENEQNSRIQFSDIEINDDKLTKKQESLLTKLRELAKKLEMIAEDLETNCPQDSYNFQTLSLEFHVLYDQFHDCLSSYESKLQKFVTINQQLANSYLRKSIPTAPLDQSDLNNYRRLEKKARDFINLEFTLDYNGMSIHKNTESLSSQYEISSTQLANLEYKKQQYVCSKFFRVKLKNNSSMPVLTQDKNSGKLYKIMKSKSGNDYPIKLDNYSARSVIIALAKLLHDKHKFPPKLCFSIGDTILIIEGGDEINQRGNAKITVNNKIIINGQRTYVYTTYGDNSIGIGLNSITNNEQDREKQLATLLREKSVKIASFNENEFTYKDRKMVIKLPNESSIQTDKMSEKTTQWLSYRIHFLNHLNFLRSIFEIARRLYRDGSGNTYPYDNAFAKRSDNIPVASAQARTSKLLQRGIITMRDAYGNSIVDSALKLKLTNQVISYNYNKEEDRAFYGAVTGKTSKNEKISDWKLFKEQKIALIDEKIQTINTTYKRNFFSENPQVVGKAQLTNVRALYEEIKTEYGSGNESSNSDSDYEDEKAISYQNI